MICPKSTPASARNASLPQQLPHLAYNRAAAPRGGDGLRDRTLDKAPAPAARHPFRPQGGESSLSPGSSGAGVSPAPSPPRRQEARPSLGGSRS